MKCVSTAKKDEVIEIGTRAENEGSTNGDERSLLWNRIREFRFKNSSLGTKIITNNNNLDKKKKLVYLFFKTFIFIDIGWNHGKKHLQNCFNRFCFNVGKQKFPPKWWRRGWLPVFMHWHFVGNSHLTWYLWEQKIINDPCPSQPHFVPCAWICSSDAERRWLFEEKTDVYISRLQGNISLILSTQQRHQCMSTDWKRQTYEHDFCQQK